jgi:hypothetical protein
MAPPLECPDGSESLHQLWAVDADRAPGREEARTVVPEQGFRLVRGDPGAAPERHQRWHHQRLEGVGLLRIHRLQARKARHVAVDALSRLALHDQELAIAYILNFENAIFLQQEGIELNGLLRYMGSNSERFKRPEEVPRLVRTLVNERHWDVRYTRHLEVGALQWSPPLLYIYHTGQRPLRVLYVDIHNRRPDVGALSAIARLQGIVHPDGRVQRDVDFSPLVLEATGKRAAYDHVVWPGTHVAWDSLGLHLEEPASVYLNSALDVARAPIISAIGKHVLGYEVFAENFAVLRFGIALVVREQAMEAEARIVASPFS